MNKIISERLASFGLLKLLEENTDDFQAVFENIEQLGSILKVPAEDIRICLQQANGCDRFKKFLQVIPMWNSTSNFVEALEPTGNASALMLLKRKLDICEESETDPVRSAAFTRYLNEADLSAAELTRTKQMEAIHKYIQQNGLPQLLRKAKPEFCRRCNGNDVALIVTRIRSMHTGIITPYDEEVMASKPTGTDKASYLANLLTRKDSVPNLSIIFMDALLKEQLDHVIGVLYNCLRDE